MAEYEREAVEPTEGELQPMWATIGVTDRGGVDLPRPLGCSISLLYGFFCGAPILRHPGTGAAHSKSANPSRRYP